VRIRVQAAPVHPTDLHILRGRYGFAPEFPAVLGVESVGIVDRLGAGVDSLAVGQRVITVGLTGTWQEVVITDAERVLAVPDGLSMSTAAQLLTNPLTAVLLTTRELAVQPGEWLLQTAAGSTVGKLVVQLGNHFGFKTINIVRRRAAVQELLELGGTEVISTEDEDLFERVAEITGGEAVRKAIDSVAGRVGAALAKSLAPGGELIVYGALDAPPNRPRSAHGDRAGQCADLRDEDRSRLLALPLVHDDAARADRSRPLPDPRARRGRSSPDPGRAAGTAGALRRGRAARRGAGARGQAAADVRRLIDADVP
jgi:NADPH:quinone reductase-like Zn-dependent oxidoreductase